MKMDSIMSLVEWNNVSTETTRYHHNTYHAFYNIVVYEIYLYKIPDVSLQTIANHHIMKVRVDLCIFHIILTRFRHDIYHVYMFCHLVSQFMRFVRQNCLTASAQTDSLYVLRFRSLSGTLFKNKRSNLCNSLQNDSVFGKGIQLTCFKCTKKKTILLIFFDT